MWQAGLLCLLASAHAVLVHQPGTGTYDSHETNKLQPQPTFRTAINTQRAYTTYTQPQSTYNKPQSIFNQPQSTFNQPQSTFNQPQSTFNQPQSTFNQPQSTYTTYTQPQTTYNHPQSTYNQPQSTYNQPQNTFNQPQQLLSHTQPLTNHQPTIPQNHNEEYYDEPNYSFNYEIHDETTGDEKTHTETRQGDVVQGSYSLIEPDGSRRIVDYIADKIGGFRAQVRREHGAAKPIVSSAKEPGYQPIFPVIQTFIPRSTQPQKYQNGPVTFSPAQYSPVQPAPVTEQSKYASVAVKPPVAYNPVVYASPAKNEDKTRTAAALTSTNQIPYNPVQYA